MRLTPLTPILIVPALALLASCGGKSDDSGSTAAPTCDEYVTAPISSLAPAEYPEGLSDGIEALRNLEGLWRGTHCDPEAPNRDIDIKITAMPRVPDDIAVVQQSVPESAACGCSADLVYGPDNHLDVVGLFPEFTLFFDPDPIVPIDPAIDQREFLVSGAVFAGQQGLFFRACDTEFVPPYLQSEYDTAVMNLRIQTLTEETPLDHLGQVSLEVQLIKQEDGAESVVCEITDFRKVQ